MHGSTKPLVSRGGKLTDAIMRHWKWLVGLTVVLVLVAAAMIGAYAWLGNTQHKSDELSDQLDHGLGRLWREQREIKRDLAELTNTVGVLSQTVQQLSEQVAGYVTAAQLNATVFPINQTLIVVNNTVFLIQAEVDALEDDVTNLEGEVVDLGTAVTQLDGDVTALNETVLAVNSTVVNLYNTFLNPELVYGEGSGDPTDDQGTTQWTVTTTVDTPGLSIAAQDLQIPITLDADGQLQTLTDGSGSYTAFCPSEDGVYQFTVSLTNVSMGIDLTVTASATDEPYPSTGTIVMLGVVQIDPSSPAGGPIFYEGEFPLPPLATTVLPPPVDSYTVALPGTVNYLSVLSIGNSGYLPLASTLSSSGPACYKLRIVFADNYRSGTTGVSIDYLFDTPTFANPTASAAYFNVRRVL